MLLSKVDSGESPCCIGSQPRDLYRGEGSPRSRSGLGIPNTMRVSTFSCISQSPEASHWRNKDRSTGQDFCRQIPIQWFRSFLTRTKPFVLHCSSPVANQRTKDSRPISRSAVYKRKPFPDMKGQEVRPASRIGYVKVWWVDELRLGPILLKTTDTCWQLLPFRPLLLTFHRHKKQEPSSKFKHTLQSSKDEVRVNARALLSVGMLNQSR